MPKLGFLIPSLAGLLAYHTFQGWFFCHSTPLTSTTQWGWALSPPENPPRRQQLEGRGHLLRPSLSATHSQHTSIVQISAENIPEISVILGTNLALSNSRAHKQTGQRQTGRLSQHLLPQLNSIMQHPWCSKPLKSTKFQLRELRGWEAGKALSSEFLVTAPQAPVMFLSQRLFPQ